MRLSVYAAFALMAGFAPLPASASPCSTDIETLSKRVQEEGKEAIAASTSGKAVAGAREGQGVTGSAAEPDPRQAPAGKSAEAGQGAEKAQAAKVALDEARTADGKGDAKGCAEAVERAKKSLSEAP